MSISHINDMQGGSIGSALAILTFYPLERIRVEIQSQQQQHHQQQKSSDGSAATKSKAENSDQEKYNQDYPADERSTTSNETILQCLIRLHKEKSLYRGAKNMAMTLMISNFIFFYALQVARKSLSSFHSNNPNSEYNRQRRRVRMSASLSSLLASTLAGVINVLLTNPMWVASLRIMESKSIPRKNSHNNKNEANVHHQPTNLWNVMRQIAKEEGLLQLWNGTFTSLLLVSNPIIQHFLYGQMRIRLLSLHRHRWKGRNYASTLPQSSSLTAVEAFVLGAISKMAATVATYPLQLAQVLLRLQSKNTNATADDSSTHKTTCSKEPNDDEQFDNEPNNNTKVYNGMIDCLHQQFKQGGIQGLFQGMKAKLLSTVLTAAFTFLSYEQTLLLVGKMHQVLLKDV